MTVRNGLANATLTLRLTSSGGARAIHFLRETASIMTHNSSGETGRPKPNASIM